MPWDLLGNAGTTQPTNFLGTMDSQPLAIRTNAAVNGTNVVHITSAASNVDAGFVGIGTNTPQTPLHVVLSQASALAQRTTIHTSGSTAGYSFNSRDVPGFTQSPSTGERWVWFADMVGTQRVAQLWTGTGAGQRGPRLLVTDLGQVLLPLNLPLPDGRDFRVDYPAVPIGTLTHPGAPAPSAPTPAELVLGGLRTSIRGFDGDPDNPGRGTGLSLRFGAHWIRTNGYEGELWMAFRRSRGIFGAGVDRSMQAAVPWNGPSFNTTSDERLKTNVRAVEGPLEKLERIRGVAYESAEAESPYALGGVPGQSGIGVVAQEVETVFPELVSIYDPDQEYKAVDYSGLTSVLIEAVKELKAQNEALRSRIEALEERA